MDLMLFANQQNLAEPQPIIATGGGKKIPSDIEMDGTFSSQSTDSNTSDSGEEDKEEEEEKKENARIPSMSTVFGIGAFNCVTSGCKKTSTSKKVKRDKKISHFRRLRMVVPKKKEPKTLNPSNVDRPHIRFKKDLGISEPQEVRDADAKMMEPHPAIMFIREHTPVKPCGRCHKCKKKPCGECPNCKNNVHLTDRSHDRKRCIALGCSRLSDEEIERYRLAHNSADNIAQIESELRTLRDRYMIASTKGTSAEELKEMNLAQDILMKRLHDIGDATTSMSQDNAPDGYNCLLISFQTLETERDRVTRLIERRTTRDSPEIMRTRRQLRNFYALTICSMVNMFANDVVARPYVEKLRTISAEYEQIVRSLPISN